MIYTYSVKLFILLLSVLLCTECTIDLNRPELQYLADHLTQDECHNLIAALHFQTYNIPQQVAAAERKLPDDVPCIDLLMHWNAAAGEGKGSTHIEVCHRLNQIGRGDLAEWLSKTVFHQLRKDVDDALMLTVTEETSRRPMRAMVSTTPFFIDESPWLNLDNILAVLVFIAISTFIFGSFYLLFSCCANLYDMHKKRSKERKRKDKKCKRYSSSEDETAKLISKHRK